ncbi:MAG: CHAT domain-containing protein [Chloroflexi bacterium]|nr:CHAT domain-containing protein [Chloroflexota bacterium]
MPTQGSAFTLFEINIQHQPRGYEHYPVVVEFTTPGNEAVTQTQGKLILDDNVIRTLREHEEWGEPDKYGQTLGELLFQGPVRDALQQAYSGTEMRILLAVNAPELRGLRWERLAAPVDNGWRMLARNENTPFAISLASSRHVIFPSLQQDEIKALVVVSHPKDIEARGFSAFDDQKGIKDAIVALSHITSEIDVLAVEAQSGIDAALAAIEPTAVTTPSPDTVNAASQTAVTVTHIGKPTEERLCTALTAKSYAILHLIAHGRVDARSGQDETYVYLANDADETTRVSAKSLIDFFIQKGNLPRFAFLVSCESARQSRVLTLEADSGPGHSGLGQRLVQEAGMHAVVAMTDEITIATAEGLAPKFYEWLAKHGYPDWALVRAGAGLRGRRDMQEIVPVLFSRLRGRPLYYHRYTETAGIPLSKTEIESGFARLKQLIDERAPGLKKDLIKKDPGGQRTSDALFKLKLAFLKPKPDWASLTDTVSDWSVVEWLNNVCYNLLDFDFVELAKGREATLYAVECPFPGLKAFGIPTDPESKAATAYFFGRDALVEKLQLRLVDEPVLAVLGASGSGKSSVVMAGLVPKLEEKGRRWQYMKPGERPLAVFERLLLAADPHLIVVDQFEEIFTHIPNNPEGKKERLAFIARLVDWVEDAAADHTLILTMRADFVSECHSYEKLADWMTDHSQQILPLTAVELRDVAWQQAANAFPTSGANGAEGSPMGLKFDPGLLNTIMSDLQEERGAMPLLQFTLRELWQRRNGRWLRANAYEELGGIGQAIAHTAEEIYQSLDKEERALMKYIFIRLTHLDESGGRGQQRRDTRHRVALKDLVPQGRTLEQVQALIYKPEMRGLLVTTQPAEQAGEANPAEPETPRQVEVEVIHEAVIRHWQRLQKWLDSDYEMLRQRQKIQQEAHEWQHEADPEKKASLLLLHASRLQEIKEWQTKNRLELNENEDAYVKACSAKEQEQLRREIEQQQALAEAQRQRAEEAEARANEQAQAAVKLRRRFYYVVGTLILAIVAGVTAVTFAISANKEATRANINERNARANLLQTQGNTLFGNNPLLGMRLLLEAYETAQSEPVKSRIATNMEYNLRTGRVDLLSDLVAFIREIVVGKLYVIKYVNGHSELWLTAVDKIIIPAGNAQITPVPNSSMFWLRHPFSATELWSLESNQVILEGQFLHIYAIFDTPFYVMKHNFAPGELRSLKSDDIVTLSDDVRDVFPIPDSPSFVVKYVSQPSELRSVENSTVVTLTGNASKLYSIPESPFYILHYDNADDELRTMKSAEVFTLSGQVNGVYPIPKSPFYVIQYSSLVGELRSIDSSEIIELTNSVSGVYPIPDSPFYVVIYMNGVGELRSTENDNIIILDGKIRHITAIPDSPLFVVAYEDSPGELWSVKGNKVASFTSEIAESYSIPNTNLFVVDYIYNDIPNEIWRMENDEAVLFLESFRRVYSVQGTSLYVVVYLDGSSDLWKNEQHFAELGGGVSNFAWFSGSNSIAVRYGNGQVWLLDLKLLEILSDDAITRGERNFTTENLIQIACTYLFTNNPNWDETELLPYLLEGESPRACQDN